MNAHEIKLWVNHHRDEIIHHTQELLRINSVGTMQDGTLSPFGEGCKQALEMMMRLGDQYGFSTRNLDGYAGHIEFLGSLPADDYVAVLAHLDVVPEGKGWLFPPFSATIHEGKIYARGAIDDKGPAMAAFFALVALKELNIPLKKTVRLILGCNEESPGWRCMKYYFEHEQSPVGGFTPDADFPLIFAEKGILTIKSRCERLQHHDAKVDFGNILAFEGGERENMVPDYAMCIVTASKNMEVESFFQQLKTTADSMGIHFHIEQDQAADTFKLEVHGKSVHGSTPELGVNAIVLLAKWLVQSRCFDDQWLLPICDFDPSGKQLGISFHDEVTGPLSVNLGILRIEQTYIDVTLNVRYPVNQTGKLISDLIGQNLSKFGYSTIFMDDLPPHYVPADSVVVQTLKKVYEIETGKTAEILTTGGGTYARAIPNAVAFGPLFPGQEELAHQKDEYIEIDHLFKLVQMYAQAIYELSLVL